MPAPARRWPVLLVLALFAVMSPAPALAHTNVTSTSPTDGEELRAAPSSVSLRFGEDLLPAGARLVAKDADGTPLELGDTEVKGPVVSATWPASAATGRFTVAYRAVARDGHPLEGTFSFSVEGVSTPSATPSASRVIPSPAPAESASPVSGTTGGGSGLNPLLWVIFAAVLIGAGVFVWRARAD
jgi:methionine-rich copper-binding protein CopC